MLYGWNTHFGISALKKKTPESSFTLSAMWGQNEKTDAEDNHKKEKIQAGWGSVDLSDMEELSSYKLFRETGVVPVLRKP